MSKVLIIRFSAIGDVAMTIPVIYSVAKANPQDSFTVLTQTFLMPLFINRPENVNVMGINKSTTEKSIFGLMRYIFLLPKYKFDAVIDLHCVIRSWLTDLVFRLHGKKIYKLDKGRKERKELTSAPPKTIKQLRPMVERYADVFRKAGFRFEETFVSLFDGYYIENKIITEIAGEKKGRWIGVAPFAKHKGKIYSVEEMEKVVETLSKKENITIFLFGGRGYEEAILEEWEYRYPNVKNVVGHLSLDNELLLISKLDVLISMDSANMHFASLVGTKVISVWGATHPFTGFYGYHQDENMAVQVDLPCRPCSIFGDKPCSRGDWACMKQISPEQIVNKINQFLNE